MKLSDPHFSIRIAAERFSPFAKKLQTVFSVMDSAYTEVAEAYRFLCTGCEDNCCRTRFFHHTYLEWHYLHLGWKKLEPERQATIESRAEEICRQTAIAGPAQETPRCMCPLNTDGLCELYEFRPMVCRLHGIPHTLQRPDGRKVIGPGCNDFYRQCGAGRDIALERTPHYSALAGLEQDFRRMLGLTDKFRLTVAEMIIRFTYLDITS